MIRGLNEVEGVRGETTFKFREELVEGDSVSIEENPAGEFSEKHESSTREEAVTGAPATDVILLLGDVPDEAFHVEAPLQGRFAFNQISLDDGSPFGVSSDGINFLVHFGGAGGEVDLGALDDDVSDFLPGFMVGVVHGSSLEADDSGGLVHLVSSEGTRDFGTVAVTSHCNVGQLVVFDEPGDVA